MAEEIEINFENNELAIDEDSSRTNEKTIKREKYNSSIVNRRKNQYSLNIFFYSYPFPIRYFNRTIGSLKKHQKK
ncbi:MAG: hypothetical protein JSV04_02420 [Candidatus Heimdallarchaeota archaeon]|nr:MAG: hypothetical protein JSV04_02420 [Candidatus Heimdallarchaeota archaeon]